MIIPSSQPNLQSGVVNEPSPQEIDALLALFKQGRYTETETLARKMTERFSRHVFGWKAMGTVLLLQGRIEEALLPLQKASELSQGDAQLYNNLGNALVKLDRLPEAEASYRKAIAVNPDFIEAHHNLGNTLARLDQPSEAEKCYRQALKLDPGFVEAYHRLGNTLAKLDRLPEAEASYRRALELRPDLAEVHNNLGNALQKLTRLNEAEASYRRALELNPDFARAHRNLGVNLNDQGRLAEAEASYRRALQLDPDFAEAHFNLGNTLKKQGNFEAATASFRSCLEIDPKDHRGARLLLASLGVEPIPLRASEALLEAFYTMKAAVWDKNLGHNQTYYGARLVAQALQSQSHQSGKLDILDAGCGTGQVGLLIRDLASRLDGVDMSSSMLESARKKEIYDNIFLSDLESFMENNPHQYDAITCAATLIHFGDLSPVFNAASACLRDDGLLVFTVFQNDSDQDGQGVIVSQIDGLAKSGCYAHSRDYVISTAETAGFIVEILNTEIHEYRQDNGLPIMCFVVVLRRLSA
jgi:predicted TPR repeat methyltransferase